MTKLEYLEKLENKLKKSMPQKEVNDIIRDYAEYFEDGKVQGQCDDEIAAKLGDPEEIAKQLLDENGYDIAKAKNNVKNGWNKFWDKIKSFKFSSVFKFVLWTILVILLLPFALAAIFTICAIVFAIISFVIGLYAAAIGGIFASIAMLIACGLSFSLLTPSIGILVFFVAIGVCALSLTIIGLATMLIIGTYKLIKFCFFKTCKAVNSKSEYQAAQYFSENNKKMENAKGEENNEQN